MVRWGWSYVWLVGFFFFVWLVRFSMLYIERVNKVMDCIIYNYVRYGEKKDNQFMWKWSTFDLNVTSILAILSLSLIHGTRKVTSKCFKVIQTVSALLFCRAVKNHVCVAQCPQHHVEYLGIVRQTAAQQKPLNDILWFVHMTAPHDLPAKLSGAAARSFHTLDLQCNLLPVQSQIQEDISTEIR